MAVLVEAISVIVRRDAIDSKYSDGWEGFVNDIPNSTLCTDDEIVRVGFMGPNDVEIFVQHLEKEGLQFSDNGKSIDLAIADQQQGLTTECDWLEFGRLKYGTTGEVSACWFFDEPRNKGHGIYMKESDFHMQIATPAGWVFEGSLSQNFGFIPTDDVGKTKKFLRHEDGMDVYMNSDSGKEEYVARIGHITKQSCGLTLLPCLDSVEMSAARRQELDIPRNIASDLGRSAVEAAHNGHYPNGAGKKVDLGQLVSVACSKKRSIPPDAPLPTEDHILFPETRIQVTNETTLGASLRLFESGLRPLALNFANGVSPGGGFLNGARAQEEVLCRSSALYQTLANDRMYEEHRKRQRPDSTDWAIYSPDVPVFRRDDGTDIDRPWLLSFITCAAPYAKTIGQPEAGDLLQRRILRVLSIAEAFDHSALVLGAWGCGAFGNNPRRTAIDFRQALEKDFRGAFSYIVFAITDWSEDRKFLGPFRDVFCFQ